MAYTQRDFVKDLAVFTAGGLIGARRLAKFSLYAARAGISLAGLGAAAAAPVLRTPVGAGAVGGVVGYELGQYALQTEPGQQLLAAAEERGRQDRLRFDRYIQDTIALARDPTVRKARRKKRMSKFNAAVKRGMSIVKGSTSYGRKGVINNPKKAFAAVAKTVSKANKGQKAPKKGILKKVFTAASKLVSPHLKKYDLPKKKRAVKRKDYRDYDPQG